MFEIPHIDAHGFTESWPAGRVYAEALAWFAGYTARASETRRDHWAWDGPPGGTAPYQPSVRATPVVAKLFAPARMLSLFFMEPTAPGITCRMLGEPWDDDTLMALIAQLRPLPYSGLVGHALIAQADWLDAHPGYRGLKIAQSERRVHVDDLGPEKPIFAGGTRQ